AMHQNKQAVSPIRFNPFGRIHQLTLGNSRQSYLLAPTVNIRQIATDIARKSQNREFSPATVVGNTKIGNTYASGRKLLPSVW
ncbi:hypothetical protein RZS08_30445, partial [Arthrospira platensis SPKY1]|nr:hypothetical protein [Arthrospira platensis SPKY1]